MADQQNPTAVGERRLFILHHIIGALPAAPTGHEPKKYAGFVSATSVEEAFKASQHIDGSEWDPGERSTSVGDIIQDDDKFWLVEGTGFKYLPMFEDTIENISKIAHEK